MRKAYQSDLSDTEWSCLESHLPAPKANGPPRIYPLREILEAIFFYVVRSGCQWRLLPHDLEHPARASSTTFPLLAFGWNMGEDARRPAKASAGSPQEESSAQRRHRRLSG
jgi:Putative transposase of IS4/5 family (DUF4096)